MIAALQFLCALGAWCAFWYAAAAGSGPDRELAACIAIAAAVLWVASAILSYLRKARGSR